MARGQGAKRHVRGYFGERLGDVGCEQHHELHRTANFVGIGSSWCFVRWRATRCPGRRRRHRVRPMSVPATGRVLIQSAGLRSCWRLSGTCLVGHQHHWTPVRNFGKRDPTSRLCGEDFRGVRTAWSSADDYWVAAADSVNCQCEVSPGLASLARQRHAAWKWKDRPMR